MKTATPKKKAVKKPFIMGVEAVLTAYLSVRCELTPTPPAEDAVKVAEAVQNCTNLDEVFYAATTGTVEVNGTTYSYRLRADLDDWADEWEQWEEWTE